VLEGVDEGAGIVELGGPVGLIRRGRGGGALWLKLRLGLGGLTKGELKRRTEALNGGLPDFGYGSDLSGAAIELDGVAEEAHSGAH